MSHSKEIKVVLAGNPNSGKSTIFNRLTGSRQTVGNFPGVTVERYEGYLRHDRWKITFVDLPGIYSFSSISDEEQAAADCLTAYESDIIVNIVDASLLERNLYLTLLLIELGKPMIVVLNRIDVARRRGMEIEVEKLSRELGVPVLKMIGNQGIGMDDLVDQIVQMMDSKKSGESETVPIRTITLASQQARTEDLRCPTCTKGICCGSCHSVLGHQTVLDVARYSEISRIGMRCVRSAIPLDKNMSDRIDLVLTNKYFGIVIFLAAMYLVFHLTFTIGQYPMEWIEKGFEALSAWIGSIWPEGKYEFCESLIREGIIAGVGGVLVFLPNILLLFFAISLLEDSGYMARAALLSDRWLHKIGLHGRSIVPMLVGFGCTIPALMATKMLGNNKERLTTMFILPLFSCGARFPIYAMLIPACFSVSWRGPVLWLIYLIGIVLAVVVAKITSCFFKSETDTFFIIELPPYHVPTFRTVGLRTLERGWQYVKKAGTVILAISIVLWFLVSYPELSSEKIVKFEQQRTKLAEITKDSLVLKTKQMEIDHAQSQAQLTESYAGRLGHLMEPVLQPMGFDWKIGTALVGAVAAKEVFVAQMGIVHSVGSEAGNEVTQNTGLSNVLAQRYSPLTCFCIMVFCLIATPCMATFVVMARESGAWKWAFAQWFFLTLLAWVLTTLIYQMGCLFI